jgi:hypothetical protein
MLDTQTATTRGWQAVRAHMARPEMRLAHLLWHHVRSTWWRVPDDEKRRFTARFGVAWTPARPGLRAWQDPILDNGSGLDFLCMHHHMVMRVNALLQEAGEPPVDPWPEPPEADDPEYRVPTDGFNPLLFRERPSKNDNTWAIWLAATQVLLWTKCLRDMPIDELGARLEYGIHNAMHERFGGYATNGHLRNNLHDLWRTSGPDWNDPEYDTLLDPYAAHVHPWFWKIHGWIDACWMRWQSASKSTMPMDDVWHGPMDAVASGDIQKLEDAARQLAECNFGLSHEPIPGLILDAAIMAHVP